MYSFKLYGVTTTTETIEQLQDAYADARDDSGEGASTFPGVTVRMGNKIVGKLSYNGRFWPKDGVAA